MTDSYEDILYLPHPVSKNHPQMGRIERAAQFSPFAALTGYGDAVKETGRLTELWEELSEDVLDKLELKFKKLEERISEHPEVSLVYFQPDSKKAGGKYAPISGRIAKIDYYGRVLIMESRLRIPMDSITEIDGPGLSGTDEGQIDSRI